MPATRSASDTDLAYCTDQLRARDRDRWLVTLWSPAAARPALVALHALDLELAQLLASTTDPAIGQIRLAWWREALQRLDTAPPPAQPVLQAAARHLLPTVTGTRLADLEDGFLARLWDVADAEAARARGRTLFAIAATLLAANPAAAAPHGERWSLGELAREGHRLPEPAPVATTPPRPLLALARLGARDLGRLARNRPPEPRGSLARQALIARTMLGRARHA